MTIINVVQNNHQAGTAKAGATVETSLRWQLLAAWVNHLACLDRQAGEAIRRLQNGLATGEQGETLAELARLRRESATGLQQLAALLKNEKAERPEDGLVPPPPDGHAWIWYSLQLFFEEWNTETADTHLWLLTRPVLCAEDGERGKERREAVSFYELTKLLIAAAWALHQEHTKQVPAP